MTIINDNIAEIEELFRAQLTFGQGQQFTRVRVQPDMADVTITDEDGEEMV